MGKIIAPLTETQVRNAKPREKNYKLFDVRTSELIETPWSEVNLEKCEWIIPWQRMKRGKLTVNPDMTDHHVCLSRQACGTAA